ncbi:hypothetical protein [Paenilisteria rocourtiae]|uniref:Inhibitor of sigma-G Gin protein n=1 Tax=Listeria rocourtiae TaxID=647910 RepID=A0A4R6ZMX6_9LIST|nr:hypothetical protein [Listeria rocourtiae]TDR53692.1 hypothetical protein DFP96_104286 [Listeria rocourtiae]
MKKIIPFWLRNWYLTKIKRPPCIMCDRIGELELEDGTYICGICAQIQGELADD